MATSDFSKLCGGELVSVPHAAADEMVFLTDSQEHTHLLTDMELELSWINDELSRTFIRLSEIESEYNNFVYKKKNGRGGVYLEKIRDEEEARLQITALMELQTMQSKRMETFKLLYSYASVYNYDSVLSSHIRKILFPDNPVLRRKERVKAATQKLAQALHHYCLDGPSNEADEEIRAAVGHVGQCYDEQSKCLVC